MQTLVSIASQAQFKKPYCSAINTTICRSCVRQGGCLSDALLNKQQVDEQTQTKRIYRKDEHVFREAEISKSFYVVRSGSVKTYFISEAGEEQILGFYIPGEVFGMDIAEDQRRASSAMVLETTTVCRLPLDGLSTQEIGLKLLKLTSAQMVCDHKLILMLAQKGADGRIASFLNDFSQRQNLRGFSGSKFNLSMSRQDVACYLGLSVETVSRTLTRLQDAGVLKVKRREVEIVNPDSLCKIAGDQVGQAGPKRISC